MGQCHQVKVRKDLPGFRQSFCEPDSTRLGVYFRAIAFKLNTRE